MVILLLVGVWIIALAVLTIRYLLKALRTGVLEARGRRSYKVSRIERQRSPSTYWFCIGFMAFVIVVMLYLGGLMVAEGLRFAVLGS